MSSINFIVNSCIEALSGVTPDNLTPAQLNRSLITLKSFNVNEAIEDYWDSLPVKPDKDAEIPAWEKENHHRGKELNHNLKLFNTELTRIKTMQSALKIPQLDVLIHAAQEVIRPLYHFSAQLSD